MNSATMLRGYGNALMCAWLLATFAGCGGKSFAESVENDLDSGPDSSSQHDADSGAADSSIPDASDSSISDASDGAPEAAIDTGVKPQDASPDVAPEASVDAGPVCNDIPGKPSSLCSKQAAVCISTQSYTAGAVKKYAFGVTADNSDVYAILQDNYDGVGTGDVLRFSAVSSGAPVVYASGLPQPRSLGLDDTWVYWLSTINVSGRQLSRTKKNCTGSCAATAVFTLSDGSTNQFLVTGNDSIFTVGDFELNHLRIVAGSVQVTKLLTTKIYPRISATQTHVYYSSGVDSNVYRVAVDGKSSAELVGTLAKGADGGVPSVRMSVASCDAVYLVGTDQNVYAISTLGVLPAKPTALGALAGDVWDMAVDSSFVYFALANGGGVKRMLRAGGAVESLAAGNVWNVAVNNDFVFYDQHDKNSAGGIFRIAK